MGATFNCLLAKQFRKTKLGDRFFFNRKPGKDSIFQKIMSDQQLQEIRKRTLGSIICDNTNIRRVRKNVFSLTSPMINCQETSSLNLGIFA